MKRPLLTLLAVAAGLSVAGLADAEVSRVKLIGTFTNLRFIPDAGDLLGEEIRLFNAADGLTALVQVAEGGPGEPALEHVEVQGDHIRIEFHNRNDGLKSFEGEISRTALRGRFTYGQQAGEPVVLKRGKSYWD